MKDSNSPVYFCLLWLISSATMFTITQTGFGQGVDAPSDAKPEAHANPKSVADSGDVHAVAAATTQFDTHPGLEVGLFAAEPMMANPSNIDVDHLGRVWVCEVVNYRHFRNTDAQVREAGDRILVLEDTDGDAVADKSTVFYQGRDIDSAHGICVLGDRVLVSANDSVFFLTDTDGDLKSDEKEILFTGISGTQHDHGIHAFVFGPDGKLYFNFGNAGKQICDATGKPIVDRAGNVVNDQGKPYRQGMVFRCNLDGSGFETLAWNFRNNWEVCVDAFGTMWQSDNDDDGNRSTRINYVMPFGDYGYVDQRTGSNWQTPRTGLEQDIPDRHWHQNDPGVIPNLLITGAGSPTGICVYEGDRLPEIFRNQIIHCDAGPSIVRSYPVTQDGAGYSADIVDMIDGAQKNQWFRPSDVCVAPDGSLIVADWYDPGVGGHRMQDVERGRLFHVTAKGQGGAYQHKAANFTAPDFSTPDSAVLALVSPNQATRFLAVQAIGRFGWDETKAPLRSLLQHSNPRFQARALWAILNFADKTAQIETAQSILTGGNEDLKVTAIRFLAQPASKAVARALDQQINWSSASAKVNRELLLALRHWPVDDDLRAHHWAELVSQYVAGDRWHLEAIGIAAEGNWDACLDAWLEQQDGKQTSIAAGRAIVWRSRGTRSAQMLVTLLDHEQTTIEQATRYFRALDFIADSATKPLLADLAFNAEHEPGNSDVAQFVMLEAASRLSTEDLNPDQRARMSDMIEARRGTPAFVTAVGKFSSKKHYKDLLEIACTSEDRQMAAEAMGVLMEKDQGGLVHSAVVNADENARGKLCDALVNSGKRKSAYLLAGVAKRADLDLSLRSYAIKRLGEIRSGAGDMLWWIDQKEPIDDAIMPAIKAALHRAPWAEVKKRADELFPMPPTKDDRPLPSIGDLVMRQGNIESGQKVFAGVGTCAKCHVVNQQGIEVGPDLTAIGSKLTKNAIYESIFFPSAGISHNYENWMVMTVDGEMITGVLLGETDKEIQLKDAQGIKHVISTEDVEQKKRQQLSLMPEGLHKEMSEQELVDLVAYLVSLKKK